MKYFVLGVGLGAAAVLLVAYTSYAASEKKLDNIFGTE
jgi:predicted small secreted protein|tara:strand:+ start:521 stop:634 length:114 start_codon:yes stop_codon:yes gene_type:complete